MEGGGGGRLEGRNKGKESVLFRLSLSESGEAVQA